MADELSWLAIGWHVAILAIVAALIAGWRPSPRAGLLLLAAPALSVAIGAFVYGNPFNGVSFGLLAVLLAALGSAPRNLQARLGPAWAVALGSALILYGWCYPHFNTVPWHRTLYAAPVGVVPCPTLAIIAGFTLAAAGFGSRAFPALLAVWSAFYAVFGIFRLGVVLDAGLFVAAVGLVVITIQNARARTHRSPLRARKSPAIPASA
jgi:hypothetical protein